MSNQHTDNTTHDSAPQLYQQCWNSSTERWEQLSTKAYRNQVMAGVRVAKGQEKADVLKFPIATVECAASETNKTAC